MLRGERAPVSTWWLSRHVTHSSSKLSKVFKGKHKISIARAVILRVHHINRPHRVATLRLIRKLKRLNVVRLPKLRNFGVPRAGTHMHRGKKIKVAGSARTHRAPYSARSARKAKI